MRQGKEQQMKFIWQFIMDTIKDWEGTNDADFCRSYKDAIEYAILFSTVSLLL